MKKWEINNKAEDMAGWLLIEAGTIGEAGKKAEAKIWEWKQIIFEMNIKEVPAEVPRLSLSERIAIRKKEKLEGGK